MRLSEKEIKRIKYEKRTGFVFFGFFLTIGAIINLVFLASSRSNIDLNLLLIIDVGIVGFSFLVLYLMNRKYNKDLEAREVIVETQNVIKKEKQVLYRAGSGTLYIPILGDLFPKIWGQKMTPYNKLNLIINNFRYEVDESLYNDIKTGEFVNLYYTKYSKILLRIEKKKVE